MKQSNYAKIFKALSNEQRLKIFMMIYNNCCQTTSYKIDDLNTDQKSSCSSKMGNMEKAFTKVCGCLNLSKSTISHHFKELQNAGLIVCERDGQHYKCRINKGVVEKLKNFLR